MIKKLPLYFSIIRSFAYGISIILINALLPLGTNIIALIFATLAGLYFGSKLGKSNLKPAGFFLFIISISALTLIFFSSFLGAFGSIFNPLTLYGLSLHGQLLLVFFLTSGLFSFFASRTPSVFLIESAILLTIAVATLAAHRNLQLDSPIIINDLSWWLGVNPITTLAALGCVGTFLSFSYGVISSILFNASSQNHTTLSRSSLKQFALLLFIFSLIGLGSFYGITSYYKEKGEGFLSNGVGQTSEEGLSPLSFQSALGSTNQPSAFVRLDNDYTQNPSSPMLYLRESALSVFNGRELVLAPPGIDRDVSRSSPEFPFAPEEKKSTNARIEMKQLVYLLTQHNLPFAIDFPASFAPIKNPNPAKFKGGAFQATSFAPTFTYDSLVYAQVGDPNWTEKERAIYLATQGDVRYHDLAKSITKDISNPIEKVKSIVSFLASHTIYTLTPGREVSATEDPVAPYLFGDGRGYCVHISHATVLMLRALGIPSRIGTGYLTDLSQSRDGHLLLRMSDRHAWAEVFITDIGWVPFDTQPLRVESHADSEVDQKLLEELMGLIDPSEEILPPEIEEPKSSKNNIDKLVPVIRKAIPLIIFILFCIVVFIKLFLFFGWIIFKKKSARLFWKHRSHLAWLYDAGFGRRFGETKNEYQKRLQLELSNDLLPLTDLIVKLQFKESFSEDNLADLDKGVSQMKETLPLFTQVRANINPSSVFAYLRGSLW